MKRLAAAALVAGGMLVGSVSTASGATLVGLSGGIVGPTGFYEVDAGDGSATFVQPEPGALGIANGGLDYLGDTLYVTNYSVSDSPFLYSYGTVNLSTGAFSSIGLHTGQWYGLAFDQSGGYFYTYDYNTSNLLKVTPGISTEIIGSVTGFTSPFGIRNLAYDDANDILYATDYYHQGVNLYTLNTNTGAATLVGSLGFDPIDYGGHVPIAYDEVTGTLFAHNAIDRSLFTLDTATGLASLVGSHPDLVFASLAVTPNAAPPVPLPAALPLLLSALGLFGFMGWRRKRLAAA